MRLAVLSSPESWYLRDLRRAAGSRHVVDCVAQSGLAAELGSGLDGRFPAGGSELSGYDAVLVRTMPPGSLEQVVFRMDVLGRLQEAGVVVVNPARAVEAAVDKYLTSAKVQAAGLLTPRTIVCQTWEDALAGFDRLGGDVVVKPLFGGEGRGITRVTDPDVAFRVFKALHQIGAVFYLQEFIPHDGYDLRLLLIGDRALAMRRRHPHDWRTNISRGATAEPLQADVTLESLARRAAAAVGAVVAGVDLLPGRDGNLYVLEVNAVPGWKGLARALGVDVAALVLEYVESLVIRGRVNGRAD